MTLEAKKRRDNAAEGQECAKQSLRGRGPRYADHGGCVDKARERGRGIAREPWLWYLVNAAGAARSLQQRGECSYRSRNEWGVNFKGSGGSEKEAKLNC